MNTKTPLVKVALSFATIFSGLTLTVQALPNQELIKAAKELGVVQMPATQASQAVRNNIANSSHRTNHYNKHDPYAAKRAQIHKQNLARRKAHQQRLAQLQRQRQLRYRNLQSAKHQINNRAGVNPAQGHHNVWNRVYSGFRFRNYNHHPQVRNFIQQYSRSPARIQQLADRSSDYLYMVVNELNRRNMPMELALLPFVESAYRNVAYSHAGAAGMWQFIPSTGRVYGLKQTKSYDARLDSHKATQAALTYLQKLNRQFRGDWLLSLAAYNAGEYRVQREINKNRSMGRPTDYWNLDLPRETRQYVPRLLAFKEIYRNPHAFGVRLRGIPNAPALARIQVNKPVNLRKVAAHAGLPASRLLSLNSGYLHGITTPRYSNQITLPRRHAGRLQQVIHRLPPARDVHQVAANRYVKKRSRSKRTRYVYHKVRRGDSLHRIARRHGTSISRIRALNNLRGNRILPGKTLKVATSSSGKSKRAKRSAYVFHKVKRGDSLYRIAKRHGTTVKKIKKLNKLSSNRIKPGKTLKIASASTSKRYS